MYSARSISLPYTSNTANSRSAVADLLACRWAANSRADVDHALDHVPLGPSGEPLGVSDTGSEPVISGASPTPSACSADAHLAVQPQGPQPALRLVLGGMGERHRGPGQRGYQGGVL